MGSVLMMAGVLCRTRLRLRRAGCGAYARMATYEIQDTNTYDRDDDARLLNSFFALFGLLPYRDLACDFTLRDGLFQVTVWLNFGP